VAAQAPHDSPMTAFLGRPRERGAPYVRCPPSPPNALGLSLKVRCHVCHCVVTCDYTYNIWVVDDPYMSIVT